MPAAVHLNPKAPRRPLANWVEWRAGSIQDPVRRLGYLRGSAEYWSKRPIRKALLDAKAQRLSAFLAVCLFFPVPMITDGAASRPGVAESASIQPLPKIWQVEATASHELYSNGLRVEKTFQARPDGPRKFQRWSIATSEREERDTPYGIVFHMTESDAIDYRENNNRHLRRASLGTMEFVRNERAYHFVVDRFGRVFRTVPENEPANHAGNSIWADKTHFYVNMNHSFLGVSFDGQTKGPDGKSTATEPQIQSAKLLTDLLRARYGIDAANCITHAQVSVKPSNRGVGWHIDWASGFPFAKLNLPPNYLTPLPAITMFGFRFDDSYANVASEELQDAISAGETVLRLEAAKRSITPAVYRRMLDRRYGEVRDPNRRPNFAP